MFTISRELLIEKGYYIYKDTLCSYCINSYQKKVIKDNVVLYFINIKETEGFNENDGWTNFWPSMQIHNKDGNAIGIDLVQWFNNSGTFSGITIEDMEKALEDIYYSLEATPYEDNYKEIDATEVYYNFLINKFSERCKSNKEFIKFLPFDFVHKKIKEKFNDNSIVISFLDLIESKNYELAYEILF